MRLMHLRMTILSRLNSAYGVQDGHAFVEPQA
jgi:hypothetical protein